MSLTLEDAIKLEDGLIKGYITEVFQNKIWDAWKAHGNDALEIAKKRQEICLEVQGPVIQQFGFEPTRAGVAQSVKAFTPEMNAHPEIGWRNSLMGYLINPNLQKKVADGHVAAPVGVLPSRRKRPEPDEWPEAVPGHVWMVVGGRDKGGIMVRSGKETTSAQFDKRLSTGAIFEEIEMEGDRIKYEKMVGDGPDMGWVSTAFKGSVLVRPLWFDLAEELTVKEGYKVVHDRVVLRAEPTKDGKMLGSENKGASVWGTLIEKDGVPWLKVKAKAIKDTPDAYMMIDGASVGLGQLLKKL